MNLCNKKRTAIVKVREGAEKKFVKYRFTNEKSFFNFIEKKFDCWYFANLYDYETKIFIEMKKPEK